MSRIPGNWQAEGFPGQRLVVIPPEIVEAELGRPVSRDLCVTHIGAFADAKKHLVEREVGAAQHVMIACLHGTGRCRLMGNEYGIGPGDLLFLPPGKAHSYRASRDEPWTIFWVHFVGLRAGDFREMLAVTDAGPIARVDPPSVLGDAFEDVFRHTERGFGEGAMAGLNTAFVRMLGLARRHRRTEGDRSRKSEDRIFRSLERMRGDLRYPWTLEELAAVAGLSVPHFSELCRRHTGLPPMGLLIRLRLHRAMELLQAGGHNVGEAAREVGYEDPYYFSRLFRKHMGMPPSACRHGA